MSEKRRNHYLFKEPIPDELIARFFLAIEVEHKNDFHWWPETMIDVPSIKEKLNELIRELEPYYWECHSYFATRVSTKKHYVQILRHMAVQWGRELNHYESTKTKMYRRGVRCYRIFTKKTEIISEDYRVRFE